MQTKAVTEINPEHVKLEKVKTQDVLSDFFGVIFLAVAAIVVFTAVYIPCSQYRKPWF